jgi:ribose transport system ATP-binding protein
MKGSVMTPLVRLGSVCAALTLLVPAAASFHEMIIRLAGQGMAILLISSDLPEVITLADRIAVMGDLRMRGELVNDHDDESMSQRIIRLIHATEASS